MSGPSLKKKDAHSSIHEAALNEAKELRKVMQKCLTDGETEKAMQVAEIVIEHWESRTLKHAEAEEEGLYKEMAAEKPELSTIIAQLTRDHDLMRRTVEIMKQELQQETIGDRMISLIDCLIIIDEFHNDDEMNKLLPNN